MRIKPRMAGTAPSRMALRPLTLREFDRRRNRVLIVRQTGGLGDILMTRMIFEDFKALCPEMRVVYALPVTYWSAVEDHPFIDEIVDSATVDVTDFLVHYNISTACGRYENRVAPFADKHRSDIWAEHCGVTLTRHDMHIRLSDEERLFGHRELRKANPTNKPAVALCPISAMQGKNLDREQMNGVARELTRLGYFVSAVHLTPIPEMTEAPTLSGYTTRQWMGVLAAADYVVSVDTSAFHFAGGIGRPLTGVFSWADGQVYGKYYQFELVQKHRALDPAWTCGPCFNWSHCPKCPNSGQVRKPCITQIGVDDIVAGARRMFARWPGRAV